MALAYAGSLRGPFVFDDQDSITNNVTIRRLWRLDEVFSPPGNGYTVQGRPILNLSLALNYAVGGTRVEGYHRVNLAIHLAACLVLFALLLRTTNDDRFAFAVTLLWGLHPLNTEAVTYVIQRAESLMGLCYLLTLFFFILSAQPSGRRFYFLLSILCCLAGMGVKEDMASAPILVLAYDAIFVSEGWGSALRKRRWYYAGLAVTWVPLALWIVASGGRDNTVGFDLARPPWQYWITQLPAMTHYLRLAIWPYPLVFDRGYDLSWLAHPAQVLPYAVATLLLVARTAWELWRRTSAGFLGLWFFAILAPTSLVPGYLQTMAEHRLYLPLIAVMALACALARSFLRGRARLAAAATLALASLYGALTAARNRDYRSVRGLWADTVAKWPSNPTAQYNLGNCRLEEKDYAAAILCFEAAIRFNPRLPPAHNNLGDALAMSGEWRSAILQYQEAIRLDPRYPGPYNNLGNAFMRLGRRDEAIRAYRTALKVHPGDEHAQHNLSLALKTAPAASSRIEPPLKAGN